MKNEKYDIILNYYIKEINYLLKQDNQKGANFILDDYFDLLIKYTDNTEELLYYIEKTNDSLFLKKFLIIKLFKDTFKIC